MLGIIILILIAEILGVPCRVLVEWINCLEVLEPPPHVVPVELVDNFEGLSAVVGRDCRGGWNKLARHIKQIHHFGVKFLWLHQLV